MSFQSLSGFRDFYPEDCRLRERIFQAWKDSARAFGFSQYDGPPLEPLDLYKKKSGDEIVAQLYHFVDKGGREVALRPEITPTLARLAGAKHRDYKKPLKWFAIPQVFRYERAQRGRLREHFQWNCDIMGEESLAAEAELLALLDHSLRALGLSRKDYVIRVSDREFWRSFLEQNGVPEEKTYEFYQALDKIDRDPPEETRKKLGALADKTLALLEQGARSERLDTLLKHTEALGLADAVAVDLRIVRGLAYYTGVVFEVHDRSGKFRAIAGGGRYDNLIGLISGENLPAIGFGMGDVVITELLKDKGLADVSEPADSYYLVIADESLRPAALKLVSELRAGGYRVDYPLSPSKVGKQFQSAEERGHRHALVVGQEYAQDGVCGLKTLATREQVTVRPDVKEGKVTALVPTGC
ncbi:MAG: histidine--tRNA ligase [Methylacidiphilales bacterium]|nr:histidine--tRNA ligase [Candidatus Methylacidiphilales bacterium]